VTRIRRSVRQPDGTVVVKSRRGPYLSDSAAASGRAIVVELQPTHAVFREHGCRQRLRLDYSQLVLWAARAEADRRRREKAQQRARAGPAGPTPRRAVRRGVLAR
jgi:hypothetical protein